MNKKEKALIRKAISFIHNDDRYNEGLDILTELIEDKTKDLKIHQVDIRNFIHNKIIN